jgi:hypothetical protein
MPGERPLNPEKDLLKLIEKPMAKGTTAVSAIRRRSLGLFSLTALKSRFAFLKSHWRDFNFQKARELDIRMVNRGLELFIFLLVFYFVLSLSSSIFLLSRPLDLKVNMEKAAELKSASFDSILKTAAYYLEKARGRDIFRRGRNKVDNLLKGPSARALEATAHLKLVGISWSADPDAMIEDTRNPRTLFLKKGQLIDNEIKLEAIFKDKIVLSYKGEEVELK